MSWQFQRAAAGRPPQELTAEPRAGPEEPGAVRGLGWREEPGQSLCIEKGGRAPGARAEQGEGNEVSGPTSG